MFEKYLPQLDIAVIQRLFRESFRANMRLYAYAIVAMLAITLSTSLSVWLLGQVVNSMAIDRSTSKVIVLALAIALLYTIKGLATYAQTYFLSRAGNRIIADQQRRIFDRLLEQGVAFFQGVPSGDVLVRVTHGAQAARSVIDALVTSVVRDFLTLVGLVLVMVVQKPLLSLVFIVFGPVAILGVRRILDHVRKFMAMELQGLSSIIQTVNETTSGIRIVKAFGLEERLRGRMNVAVSDVEKQANRIARLEAATSPLMETLGGVTVALMLVLSAVLVLEKGQTPGELASFVTAALMAYEPAKRLAKVRVTLAGGLVGVQAMFELLDRPLSLMERPDARPLPASEPPTITFDAADFHYRDGHPVLKNLSVVFNQGETTALVGPSGSGKSTIVNLILRLYDLHSGIIRFGDVDIRDVTLKSLRARMAYVGQDSFLFSGTVRENIAVGRDGASEEEIVAAARAANAHDFITALPGGYDCQVGEGGGHLSGGQRQRVTIARAMIRNCDVLILDEPTSALDSESESLVREALDRLTAGRTTIIIAHRLSTVARADKIVVIDHGEVIEQGRHSELLKQNGLYSRLSQFQSLPA